MGNTSSIRATSSSDTAKPADKMANLQRANLGSMMGLGGVCMEAISDMGAEVASFIAERIKEAVKAQHAILNCKNAADLQHVQAAFVQKAVAEYQAETGKLLQMGTEALAAQTEWKTGKC